MKNHEQIETEIAALAAARAQAALQAMAVPV